MRKVMVALAMVLALGLAVPAGAQTHAEARQTDNRSMAVTIDLATVGGGLLALVTASGLVSLYNAGSMMLQGTPIVEALEVGAGLPLPAVIVAVIVGGMYGQDIVKQSIAPLFGAGEPARAGH
ncbi:MAG: hypothetical protein WCO00_04835 [Rhodospirillaceae bacterium]